MTLTITCWRRHPWRGAEGNPVTVTTVNGKAVSMDLSGLSNAEYRVLVTGENTAVLP
ncbi:hypothetical protein O9993_15240 [Vibrio lentus]|nr:hypothetical protein [Vibrio lentus]